MRGKYSVDVDGERYMGLSTSEALRWLNLFQGDNNPFPRSKTMILRRWHNTVPCSDVECLDLHLRLVGKRIFARKEERA